MKKFLSVLMCLAMICQILTVVGFAKSAQTWEITNPYENVNWDTYKSYKTQLHCHTTASDGYLKIRDAIQKYYDLDYDIVAITDHGTLNKGWDTEPDLVPIMRAIKKERTGNLPVEPLTAEEYTAFTTGTAKTSNGTTRTYNDGMLDVMGGIELNMATPVADCHLTGYWSDYGQGLAGVFGDYETPSKGVKDAGGVSMLSHVGEYVYTDKDSADHVGQKVDEYYANKFARLFIDNAGSSAGMGINSATDCHTRCDRILYDQVLQKTIPNGVVPWGFTFSDSHNDTSMNDAYTYMLMPEKTEEALRESMLSGAFFAVSHYSNGVELNGMEEMPGTEKEGDGKTMRDIDAMHMNDTPLVTKVTTEGNKILVECKNANQITWVSNGNVIKRAPVVNGKAEIDLNEDGLLDEVSLYVRFYITGEQGICYANPMVVKHPGETFEPVEVPKTHDVSTRLRTLVTVLDWILFKWSPIIWIFKYFALGYNPISRLWNDINIFK